MNFTYRYRLLPAKRQHRALETILEAQRQLYNAGLEERVDAYRKAGIQRSCFDQFKALTEWRDGDPEARSVPVNLQRWTLKRLDDAYDGFFRRLSAETKPGFPRYRGKGRFNSFGFHEFCGISFDGRSIRFRGMPGRLRVHVHRPFPEGLSIKSCVFRRDVKGWTVGLVIKCPEAPPRTTYRAVGVDLGISIFAALSDGGLIPSLRAARKAERRLRVLRRAVSRKQAGSHCRVKARLALRRCYAQMTRARDNHLHQASARLVRDYDRIAIEGLNIKGLVRAVLAKDVHDVSWSKFISMLRYKAECAGVRLIVVDPHQTSQECSGCGTAVPKRLSDRVHDCPSCGLRLDRDLNAARNILNRAGVGPGLRNVAGPGMRAGGNLDANVGPCVVLQSN